MALFELPLSVLNNIPAVSGVDDVELEIPQADEVADALEDVVLDPDDIQDVLEGDILEGIADATPVDEIAQAVVDLVSPVVNNARDDIIDSISAEVTAALSDIEIEVDDINVDEDELADEITDQLETGPEGEVIVNFESVFGALSQDIKDGFAFALEDIIGSTDDLPEGDDTLTSSVGGIADTLSDFDPDVDVPGVDDIVDGLLGELEDLPGFELLTDPVEFAEFVLDELADGLVDDEVLQETQDTIDEVL